MSARIAISGLGRIGRLVLRAIYEEHRSDVTLVAVNDTAEPDARAHLLKYDSVHGRFAGDISSTADSLTVNGHTVPVVAERDPKKIDWAGLGVDIVLDCTGAFKKRDDIAQHLTAGAKKVLVSAPTDGEDRMVVYGINHDALTAEDRIVSAASCTTNCVAPVAKVLNDTVGIRHGFMTTVHAYTSDQRLHDNKHKDLHRARAANLSLVPTSTGAAKSVGRILPELKGKLDGTSVRVPVANVSMVDLKIEAARATTAEEIKAAFEDAAAEGKLKGVLGTYREPLVSIDFNHDPHSAMVGVNETKVVDDTMVRVMAWYDNEWAFSLRMLDVAAAMHAAG